MPRSRNIKPAFFNNDVLAEANCPLGRLLFIGLWCLADYKGDVEWRPGRIKVQVLPYDDCDVKKLAINLDKSGFVTFYSDGEKIYLRINNFERHQNPHPNERKKGSDIPSYSESMRQAVDLKEITINREKSRQKSDGSVSDHADSCSLNPDPLSLIPDVCAEPEGSPPAASESPEVISIPTNRYGTVGEEYCVTEAQVIEWANAYPAVNVVHALNRIRSWNMNNPSRRKTMRGMAKHIDSWLAREQDKGGNHGQHQQNSGSNAGFDTGDTSWADGVFESDFAGLGCEGDRPPVDAIDGDFSRLEGRDPE